MQIGSALASSLGQWVRMPESRMRIMVACGAAGGISATFNAPVTGVFFGVEIILREFSVDALFTVMLSAMIADVTAEPEVYGRDGLPVISADGQLVQGWVTSASVVQALARQVGAARSETARAQLAADWGHQDLGSTLREPPAPLPGYQLVEITLDDASPAAGRRISDVAWPAGSAPVTILSGGRLRAAGPGTVLRAGDRVGLLAAVPRRPGAAHQDASTQTA